MRRAVDGASGRRTRPMVTRLAGMAIGVAAVAATPMRTHPMAIIAVLAGCGVVWGMVAAVRLYSGRGVPERVESMTAGIAASAGGVPTAEVSDSWGAQRRSFLKACGVGTLGAIPVMMLPSSAERLIREIVAPGSHNGVKSTFCRTSATGPSGRIRQWSMIVDLRSCDGCQSQGTRAKVHAGVHRGSLRPPTDAVDRGLRGSSGRGRHPVHPDAVPAVPKPAVHERVPGGSHLLHSRGDGPDRSEPVHRVSNLHGGLPVRPALLQLGQSADPAGVDAGGLLAGASNAGPARHGHEVRLLRRHGSRRDAPLLHPSVPEQGHLLRRPRRGHRHQRRSPS